MSFEKPTGDELGEAERLKTLCDKPIDLTDPDCPPADFIDREWHRGLPNFWVNHEFLHSANEEQQSAGIQLR